MRTVDPVQWSKKIKKPPINVARPWRYRTKEMSVFERRLRKSFSDAMLEFLRNCSVEGVGAIVDKCNPKPVRWCCFMLLVSTITCCLIVTTCNVVWLRSNPPLSVVLQSYRHPVGQIDFPAVALCSYNIISKTELDKYAKHLYSLEKNNTYTMASLKRNLLAFSGLITRSHVPFDANFTSFLAKVAHETNVTNVIYKLSPKCESMLVRCSWLSRRRHCERLFAMRLIDIGYCCVFNARYSGTDRHNPPYRVNAIGHDNGLSVVVKENTDDFTYVRRTGDQLEMLLFDGKRYPLIKAGVLRTYPIMRNASVYVTLKAEVQHESQYLQYYTESWIGCHPTSRGGHEHKSWAQCVADCRVRAVRALCMCSPHTKLDAHPSTDVTCTLEHIPCLAKHKEKLEFFYPGEHAHESLSEEKADSVECLHCLHRCARLQYSADLSTVPYVNVRKRPFFDRFMEGLKLLNGTVIRINFAKEDQQLHLVETYLRFYEVISHISSQWVFLAGITVITVFEFIYHCTIRWYHHFTRRLRQDNSLPKFKDMDDIKVC